MNGNFSCRAAPEAAACESLRQLVRHFGRFLPPGKVEDTLLRAGQLFVERSGERPPEARRRFLRLCAHALQAESLVCAESEEDWPGFIPGFRLGQSRGTRPVR